MANSTENLTIESIGADGYIFHLPVKAGVRLRKGTFASHAAIAGGPLVPYSTASSGPVVGVVQHEADNSAAGAADGDQRVYVETERAYAYPNGTSGDAFTDTTAIGTIVYATDDHTVAKTSNGGTRQPVGFFLGLESDGKVRVRVSPAHALLAAKLLGLSDSPATADALRDGIVAAMG